MKIATITCQHVYNYGATLQAFALQHYLESLGHEVEIISYRPTYQHRYDLAYIPESRKLHKLTHWCSQLERLAARYWVNKNVPAMFPRRDAFDIFDENYLHLTPTIYNNVDELRRNPPQADIYVAGSDQIWNTDGPNGRDAAYYLDFGTAKKFSYAASFAVSEIADEWKPFVKQQLPHFSAISVREKTGLKILGDLGFAGVNVVDPVFLLSAEEWKKALDLKPAEGNYIFLYDFLHNDMEMRDFALEQRRQTGLHLLSVNDYQATDYADENVNDAGPREFLQYLLGAKYVVCESFHATAFSLIFHKQFATWPLVGQRNSSRMTDLLKSAGLISRFNAKTVGDIASPVRWEEVNGKLSGNINSSKDWLISNLE